MCVREFHPRTSEFSPTDMNRSVYFNSPIYVGKNNYYKGNTNYQCVAFANARSSEIASKPITYWNGTSEQCDVEKPLFNRYGFGDAKNWLKDTNWETGKEAKLGAIMVYGDNYGNGYGHVRIVEKIEGNKITYSAANENNKLAFKTIDLPKITEHDFLGYIYNPYVDDMTEYLKSEIERLNKKLVKIKDILEDKEKVDE